NKAILFMMDVDRFKSINDTYGHDIGDSVICQLGTILASKFTDGEILGRFGGDEFIVFIKDMDDVNTAKKIAEGIINAVSENVTLPDSNEKVSVSIGAAVYKGQEKNYSEIFKKADVALYKSKADADNRFYVYGGF
ncbi:MAG: GGDEF domain-containing protein, partial [Treponema sp.]|nr:GGDEF domain-containing protein [Treponema sp.]